MQVDRGLLEWASLVLSANTQSHPKVRGLMGIMLNPLLMVGVAALATIRLLFLQDSGCGWVMNKWNISHTTLVFMQVWLRKMGC